MDRGLPHRAVGCCKTPEAIAAAIDTQRERGTLCADGTVCESIVLVCSTSGSSSEAARMSASRLSNRRARFLLVMAALSRGRPRTCPPPPVSFRSQGMKPANEGRRRHQNRVWVVSESLRLRVSAGRWSFKHYRVCSRAANASSSRSRCSASFSRKPWESERLDGGLVVEPFTIAKETYTSLGGVAGQVISYLQSELEAAIREPFAGTVRLSGQRNEIDGWRRVLTTLVKTQINGTVTTDVIPEETLRKEAVKQGCEIEPRGMFQFLTEERRRILRYVDVNKVPTQEVIRCCSLGHDVLASALREWSERTERAKLDSDNLWATLRTTRGIMSNIKGKAYAMSAMTPMRPWKTPVLRVLLFLLGVVRSSQADLKHLSFIHFAKWVIVRRTQFPVLSPRQQRERLKYDYLIFFANLNGTWNQCMESFSTVLSNGIDLIWRWSEKFPGATRTTQFKQYIASVQFVTDYYYTAYPYATISDVKAAHRVQAALDAIAKASEAMSPDEFEKAYLQFVVKVQCDLGAIRARTG